MTFSAPFIKRPSAPRCSRVALLLAGMLAYFQFRSRRCRRSISR